MKECSTGKEINMSKTNLEEIMKMNDYDKEKMQVIMQIERAYRHGELDRNQARKQLKERVGTIAPQDIAIAEQELKLYDTNQCQKLDIQSMMDLFEGLMDISRPDLPEDHPIIFYYRENDEMRKVLNAMKDLVQYPVIKNQWYEIYDQLKAWFIHLTRKQNQLYPVLEQKGFDRPTTTMWTLDDFVKDEVKAAFELLDHDEDAFIAEQSEVMCDIQDLIEKEESVLYPTSLAFITQDEFEHMKSGDREIGFGLISVEENIIRDNTNSSGKTIHSNKMLRTVADAQQNLTQELDVATGKLTLDQINLIFRNMPVDLSYVDENEIVKFYTDTEHRIFPRSKNVIGRDVKNCHPRKSVHIVKEIVEKFKKGEQDFAEFWINKPELFLHITYTAVRDDQGKFKGILEMMQDCTHIRNLEGSQTLLTWNEKNGQQQEKQDDLERVQQSQPERQDEQQVQQVQQNQQEKNEQQQVQQIQQEEQQQGLQIHQELQQDIQIIQNGDKKKIENAGKLNLTPDLKLNELFLVYPQLKSRMPEIYPDFKILKTPLARVMMKKATLLDAAERVHMSYTAFVSQIEKLLEQVV